MEDTQAPPTPPEAAMRAETAPIMDVVAPPPPTADETVPAAPANEGNPEPKAPAALAHQKAPPKPKTPRTTGANAAIFSTVIIVLGLAMLAVFAYLQQK
jgi:hypothetical protein